MNNGQMVEGLTLRDYFAANAMCGLMSTTLSAAILREFQYDEADPADALKAQQAVSGSIALMAYSAADAMLAFRKGDS